MYPATLLKKNFYPTDSSEGRVLDATTDFKLAYFFGHLLVIKKQLNISFFTKEAAECKCENSDEEAQDAGGEDKKVEEDESEEPEKRLEIDTESAGTNCVESRY